MNDSEFIRNVAEQLKVDEGYKGFMYKDSEGKTTIGYGHNLDDIGFPQRLAELVLYYDLKETIREVRREFLWFKDMPESKQEVVVNMAFNVGMSSIRGFKRMLFALSKHDYLSAAKEMIDSKWYTQVGQRARRLVSIMSDGRLS